MTCNRTGETCAIIYITFIALKNGNVNRDCDFSSFKIEIEVRVGVGWRLLLATYLFNEQKP